jgi:hypothetical protein
VTSRRGGQGGQCPPRLAFLSHSDNDTYDSDLHVCRDRVHGFMRPGVDIVHLVHPGMSELLEASRR